MKSFDGVTVKNPNSFRKVSKLVPRPRVALCIDFLRSPCKERWLLW